MLLLVLYTGGSLPSEAGGPRLVSGELQGGRDIPRRSGGTWPRYPFSPPKPEKIKMRVNLKNGAKIIDVFAAEQIKKGFHILDLDLHKIEEKYAKISD